MNDVRALAKQLETSSTNDPSAARLAAIRLLGAVVEADASATYSVVDVGGRRYSVDVEVIGDAAASQFFERTSRDGFSADSTDYLRRPVRERTRFACKASIFRSTEARSTFSQSDHHRLLEELAISEHIRLLVFHGDHFVANVSCARQRGAPPFTRRDERRAQPLVQAIRAVLIAAEAADTGEGLREAADLLVQPNGSIDLASGAGRLWLEDEAFRDELTATVRAFDAGKLASLPVRIGRAAATLLRLDGDIGVRFLVHVEPARGLCGGVVLTDRQRAVACSVAQGRTLQEVATELGVSRETAKVHLAQVYRRLGISSRAQLASHLAHGKRAVGS